MLIYAANASGDWEVQTLSESGEGSSEYVNSFVDSDDYVHITYGGTYLTDITGEWESSDFLLSYSTVSTMDESGWFYAVSWLNSAIWYTYFPAGHMATE